MENSLCDRILCNKINMLMLFEPFSTNIKQQLKMIAGEFTLSTQYVFFSSGRDTESFACCRMHSLGDNLVNRHSQNEYNFLSLIPP